MNLSPAITFGQDVIVSYTDPTTGDDTTGVIQDAAGNDTASFTTGSGGVPAVTHQPRITEIDLTSDPGADDTYAIDDAIEATVTFSEAVTVTGTPQMALDVGGGPRTADYASGSGSTDLVFSYAVVEGDLDADGVAVEKDEIALNSGTITAGGTAVSLTYDAVAADPDHKVDGVRPIFVSAETNEAGTRVFITFSEPISAVNTNEMGLSSGASLTFIEIDGAVVELDPTPDFAHASTWTVGFATGAVRDLAGNANALAGGNNPITNNVPEPNAPPAFTSAASFSVAENQTAVDMVEATDEDAADTVSYAITGGADQAKFDIDASSGVLTFKDAPDHENPTDAGGNNTYMVTVTATGGTGDRAMTAEQSITVTVTDVDEIPAVLTVVVTSSPGTGTDTYGQGQTIEVTVTFNQAVTVTGTPRIEFEVGGNNTEHLKWATYASGSGTTSLRFAYVVVATDMDSNGIWIQADKLELNSGTIQGVDDDVAATLTYVAPGFQADHKVDGSLVGTRPSAPAPPWVQALDGSTSALDVRWAVPGDSVVDSYDLRYRKDGSGDWEDGPQDVADTRSEITGLESGASYEVQVRATNRRGDSGWSASTTGYPATVYDIDGIYIYWTDRQGSEKLHDDVADLGSNTLENACDTGESFRAWWLQPLESRDADEWEADVQTIDGTGTAQYTLRTAPELIGAVSLDGFTIIGIRIRGRFGEDWSNWSRAVNLICVPTEDDSGSATGNSSTGSENATSNPLTGFELVDATAHLDAGAVDDGMTLTDIDPDKVYGFRANILSGAELRSVKLELRGPGADDMVTRTDNYQPYSLHGAALAAGSYTLTATAYSETNGGGSQLGTLSVDFTVVGEPLTARFEGLPEGTHGGAGTPFTFRLVFSEAVSATPEGLRDHALQVTNATVEAVSRVDDRSDLWEVRLTPESDAMVTVSLLPAADCDAAGAVCTEDGRMLSGGVARVILGPPPTSAATAAVEPAPNSEATGAPTIGGTARLGETLSADVTAIADEDGLENAVFSYQWIRRDGTTDTEIADATGVHYTLVQADIGKTLKVRVTFTDGAGHEESLTSPPTAAVTAPPLTATLDSVPASHDGSTEFTFELHFSEEFKLNYTVLRDEAFTVTGGTITKATRVKKGFNIKREIYVQPDGDGAVTIVLPVTTDCADDGAICTVDGRKLSRRLELTVSGPGGAPTTTDEPAPNTQATGQPTISGTAQVGQTLTADTSGIADEDGLDNVTFSYQWMADDANIQGATGSSYTLADRDKGKTIKVIVSFTDDANNEESLPSAATDAVVALPGKPQSLAGEATAQEIQLTWKAPTGPAVVEYVVYRGILQNGSMNRQALSKYATIDAAGKAMTYTDGNVEEGVEYRYRVAAVNADGEGKKSTWLDITAE